jgi:magnesium chelatase family protein
VPARGAAPVPRPAPHHLGGRAGGRGRIAPAGGDLPSHNGVLFLDEITEFRRDVLEVLRQPMESGRVVIARAACSLTFPARFQLAAAANPCPCGHLGDPRRECRCTPPQVQRYRARLSGPLLDRIDLQLEVPPVPYRELARRASGEPSRAVRERVVAARARQARRLAGSGRHTNSELTPGEVRTFCSPDGEGERLLELAMTKLALSARGLFRILRVARTIVDLEGGERLLARHIAEAISYRSLDRLVQG